MAMEMRPCLFPAPHCDTCGLATSVSPKLSSGAGLPVFTTRRRNTTYGGQSGASGESAARVDPTAPHRRTALASTTNVLPAILATLTDLESGRLAVPVDAADS